MKRLQMLYVTFGVVVGAIVGVMVTAAITRSGNSDAGSVRIIEQHHGHSTHHGAGEEHGTVGNPRGEEKGVREEEYAENPRGDRADIEHHQSGRGDVSDSIVRPHRSGRHGPEDHHDDHDHEH